MSALLSEVHVGDTDSPQMPLELASDGVLRYVWESKFGPMLIEARDGVSYVNGTRVTSADEQRLGMHE